jgi:hypothetical protein
MISVRNIIHRYAASVKKTWEHDRSKTVGASEIGQCARKTWFSKQSSPQDKEFTDGWGARFRGDIIEDALWVPAMRTMEGVDGWTLLFAGLEQRTFSSGYLSATTDGLLYNFNTLESINLDCKSIDPRVDISREKTEHHFQVQAQMGLIRDCTSHRPDISILSYINASFLDDVTEFVIQFNPRIYAQAHARATQIMTAREAIALPPEGKMAGGDECKYCPWASYCADVTVAGVPKQSSQLGDNAVAHLKELYDMERAARSKKETWEAEHTKAVEEIKSFLRNTNSRGHRGDGWSVSYSVVAGRETLDIRAAEAAGIDLTPFYKTGRSSERLTVR